MQRGTLGIDVGTTSVKAGLIDESGRLIARFAKAYPTRRTGAQLVEQDPEDWIALIREALESFADHDVSAIGLTSQVNTHVFVGADHKALIPAIVWQDGRASEQAAALDAKVTPDQKIAWWGAPMPIDASHACARMAWVAEHQPQVWERTRYVMLPKDFCLLRMTGEATTDPLSNIGLVDGDLAYIPKVFDLIDGAAERAAPLAPVTGIIGQMQEGPFKGTPVVSGTMDAWAGLVGTGGARNRTSVYLSGTSEILGISSHDILPTPGVIVFPECEGVRVHAAPTQSGGDAALWYAQGHSLTLDEMTAMVGETTRSAATPMFLPQLQGERAPIWDADLRAAFLGVSRQTRQADFARAIYEGVAMGARMALEALQASANVTSDSIACGGGGFQSAAWNQIRADVLGVELKVLYAKDPGVLGAATMAAIGAGHYSGFEEAYKALARFDQSFAPQSGACAFYDDLYGIYQEAITLNADLGKRLTQVNTAGLNS